MLIKGDKSDRIKGPQNWRLTHCGQEYCQSAAAATATATAPQLLSFTVQYGSTCLKTTGNEPVAGLIL